MPHPCAPLSHPYAALIPLSNPPTPPLLSHATQAGALQLHGSATALPWRGQYLALFHTVSAGAGARGAYTSFAYTFSAEPPFAITGVSRALPLARLLPSHHPALVT